MTFIYKITFFIIAVITLNFFFSVVRDDYKEERKKMDEEMNVAENIYQNTHLNSQEMVNFTQEVKEFSSQDHTIKNELKNLVNQGYVTHAQSAHVINMLKKEREAHLQQQANLSLEQLSKN